MWNFSINKLSVLKQSLQKTFKNSVKLLNKVYVNKILKAVCRHFLKIISPLIREDNNNNFGSCVIAAEQNKASAACSQLLFT